MVPMACHQNNEIVAFFVISLWPYADHGTGGSVFSALDTGSQNGVMRHTVSRIIQRLSNSLHSGVTRRVFWKSPGTETFRENI